MSAKDTQSTISHFVITDAATASDSGALSALKSEFGEKSPIIDAYRDKTNKQASSINGDPYGRSADA